MESRPSSIAAEITGLDSFGLHFLWGQAQEKVFSSPIYCLYNLKDRIGQAREDIGTDNLKIVWKNTKQE